MVELKSASYRDLVASEVHIRYGIPLPYVLHEKLEVIVRACEADERTAASCAIEIGKAFELVLLPSYLNQQRIRMELFEPE